MGRLLKVAWVSCWAALGWCWGGLRRAYLLALAALREGYEEGVRL